MYTHTHICVYRCITSWFDSELTARVGRFAPRIPADEAAGVALVIPLPGEHGAAPYYTTVICYDMISYHVV